MFIAVLLFVLTYVLLLLVPKYRPVIALGSAAAFVLTGIVTPDRIAAMIDWNVLLMISGTMGLVALFIDSGMPARLADLLLARTGRVQTAVVVLAGFAGLISAFVDNVATVLMVAPVALVIARRQKISPVPVLIAISVSSNLQGAATLVGDTTSILLGGHAGLDFLDFFIYDGKPGIFFVVQAGACAALLVLFWKFRKFRQPVAMQPPTSVSDYFPTLLLLGMVGLLITASFLPQKPELINGLICCGLCLIGLIRTVFRTHGLQKAAQMLCSVDLNTLLLLAGLFVVIGGLREAGVVDAAAQLLVKVSGSSVFMVYTLIVWGSVVLSAFIDNIPYVATMLPVTAGAAQILGTDASVLYFGLMIGATLGGNLSPIGASANIAAVGILHKNGETVSNREFCGIGIPFTLAAVSVGYVLIWLLYGR